MDYRYMTEEMLRPLLTEKKARLSEINAGQGPRPYILEAASTKKRIEEIEHFISQRQEGVEPEILPWVIQAGSSDKGLEKPYPNSRLLRLSCGVYHIEAQGPEWMIEMVHYGEKTPVVVGKLPCEYSETTGLADPKEAIRTAATFDRSTREDLYERLKMALDLHREYLRMNTADREVLREDGKTLCELLNAFQDRPMMVHDEPKVAFYRKWTPQAREAVFKSYAREGRLFYELMLEIRYARDVTTIREQSEILAAEWCLETSYIHYCCERYKAYCKAHDLPSDALI